MQVPFLEGSPQAGTSHGLQDLSGCLSQYLFDRAEERAPEQGLPVVLSEGQAMMAAFFWG